MCRTGADSRALIRGAHRAPHDRFWRGSDRRSERGSGRIRHRGQVQAAIAKYLGPDATITAEQAKSAAATCSSRLDGSLRELQVDKVDAYYLMASNNVGIVGSEEITNAFEKAKQAGKVDHLGLSTHQNQGRVLSRARDTGWYSLATMAITPAGWYDRATGEIDKNSRPMADLQPFLGDLHKAGIGLVGMKAGRHLAGPRFFGFSHPNAFDPYYGPKLLASKLSAFQRSYAFVLAHGLDVVNADMQSVAHLRANVIAAASSEEHVGNDWSGAPARRSSDPQ
jgi:hypothetical protein